MTSVLPADVVKEIRALMVPWLACIGVMVLSGLGMPVIRGYEVGAYYLGMCVLGGLSIGHEYTHRTLPMLLSLPARRERVFLIKWTVLAIMLLAINLVAIASIADMRDFPDWSLVWLTMLCCLFISPWMTMLSRNPLAGAIFGMSVPGTIFVTWQLLYYWVTGVASQDDEWVLRDIVVALSAVGAVMSWRTFMRLEAADGSGQIRLLAWSAAPASASVTKQRPTWLLIKKELGLHQIPIALALFQIGGSLVALALKTRFEHMDMIYDVMTVFYCGSTVLVIGCVASAEERQLGTHEWQLLLPISSAWQWTIKVLVAVALMILISLVLPSPFLYLMNESRLDIVPVLHPSLMIGATAILMFGLYVSSLSTNTMRAIVVAVVAFALGFWPGSRLADVPEARRFLGMIRSRLFYGVFDDGQLAMRWLLIYAVELLVFFLFVSIVFRFGLSNHRSAAPVGRHLVGQGLVIAFFMSLLAFVATGGVMLGW